MSCIFTGLPDFATRFYTARSPSRIERHTNYVHGTELTAQEQHLLESFTDGEVIGRGSSRVVLRPACSCHCESVVKIARGAHRGTVQDGREQNQHEQVLYQAERHHESQTRLLPIQRVDDDDYWLEMPYATPLTDLNISMTKQDTIQATLIEELSSIHGEIAVGEINSLNIGRYNNSYYLLDYGALLRTHNGDRKC